MLLLHAVELMSSPDLQHNLSFSFQTHIEMALYTGTLI